MDAGRECWGGFKNLLQGIAVTQINVVKDKTLFASAFVQACKFCDPIEGDHARIDEIVDDHHIVALLQKTEDGVASNVSSSSGDQDGSN